MACTSNVQNKSTYEVACTSNVQNKSTYEVACTSNVQHKSTYEVACTSNVQHNGALTKRLTQLLINQHRMRPKSLHQQSPRYGEARNTKSSKNIFIAQGHEPGNQVRIVRSRSYMPCYNKSNQVRIMRSRSSVPCYNKSNSNAQSPKLINSAQGPEPKNQVRIVRSRSSVPCYNKSNRDSSTYSSQRRPGTSRKRARATVQVQSPCHATSWSHLLQKAT